MTGRERARAALRFQKPDKVALQYYYTPVGFFEHGEKLNDLFASLPGDFEPFVRRPIPTISPADRDENGEYHAFRKDDWGATTEYRIYGIAGLPCRHPLADWGALDAYRAPALPPPPVWTDGYYRLASCGSLLERMRTLRPDEDVYCDLAADAPELHRLADIVCEYDRALVTAAVAAGADGVAFGDDYGTERGLLIGADMWRRFFKPRLARVLEPAVRAGLDVVFHSCGQVGALLEDLREVGATAVWPQLPAYDMAELAARCRNLRLAVAVHTDRARTMTFGTPEDVRELALREFETFRMDEGGAWFYVEADNGFPFENLESLVTTIAGLRA